jgi:hypothetical protein
VVGEESDWANPALRAIASFSSPAHDLAIDGKYELKTGAGAECLILHARPGLVAGRYNCVVSPV